MKTTCPECGTVHDVKTNARKGGKARWKGVSKTERSEAMRAAVMARWAKRKAQA